MEQYEPPVQMDETPNPVNIPLPPSLPISTNPSVPSTRQQEYIPLPPVKKTAPSSLDLIPLPWDVLPFQKFIDQLSPQVTSLLQLPLIVSMTPSHTTPLLPKNPLTENKPLTNRPTPPEWKRIQSLPVTGKQKELSPELEPSPPVASSSQLPQIPPIRTTPLPKHPLTEDEPLVNKEGPPSWSSAQPSPIMGKRQESPRHVAMLLKHEQSDPETKQSMSPKEHPTPPDSPQATAVSTPSSFGFTRLYGTPTQTTIEIDEEMEEGEISNSSMEEGEIADTRQSTLDSIDIGIPHVPSNWLQPSSP